MAKVGKTKLAKTLRLVLGAADKAYGDGLVLSAWREGSACGDGLAEFVYRELLETHDDELSPADCALTAAEYMQRAQCQLGDVVRALLELEESERKKQKRRTK